MESRFITLSINRDLRYINESVATKKFKSVAHKCGKGWRLIGQKVLLLNEVLAHLQYDTKTIHPFISASIGRLNLHIKRTTKCDSVAKIQGTWVAKL